MTTKQTVEEVVSSITNHKPEAGVRVLRNFPIGRAIQQGDVYLHSVSADWPRGKKLGTRQVAVGTTVGSRHVAEGETVEVFEGKKLPPSFKRPKWCQGMSDARVESIFLGPVVVVPGKLRLTHPEHDHHKLPACVAQVTYQGDPRTAERVRD